MAGMMSSFSFICSMQSKKSAPMRSSLLTKAMRGTLCLLAWCQTVSRLHFDAADGAEDADGAVEDAQAAFDLGGEIDVAGGVDQGDARVAPFERRRRRC